MQKRGDMTGARKKIIANVERLNRLMDRDGLAAVVARSGENFTYMAGFAYPGTLARHLDLPDSDRGVILVWPRSDAPVLIVNDTAAGLAERDSWVERIEVYEGYLESPFACLARVLDGLGLATDRVGFEARYVSAHDWAEVANALPGMRMTDCTALMDEVRWIKTPGEIKLIKRAADLLDDAYLNVFQRLQAGDTERHAHAMMMEQCLERGFGWAHGILNSSTNTIPYAGESDVAFNTGDVLRTDYVAYLDGYPGHQSRNAIFGEPSAAQLREYNSIRDIYRATIYQCRAGARVADVYDFATASFAADGWKFGSLLVGHSVGAWWHQQEPILRRGSEIVLEEGMVLALEPHIGHWHIQDMIVVRDGDPELLSDKFDTDAPFVIT
jgi:Xaa-Pro aminopeptidase